MSKDQAIAALEVVDNTLNECVGCEIQKSGEGKPFPFENAMVELLLTKWGNATKKSFDEVFKHLKSGKGVIDEKEKVVILKLIEQGILKNFSEAVSAGISKNFEGSYKRGKKDVFKPFKQKVVWNTIDDNALQWIQDHHMFWIGDYYDRHVSKSIADNISSSIEQGLGRVDAGKKLEEFFEDYPGVKNKPENYWRGLSANAMNRTRNFSLIQSYVDIEIVNLKILVVDDERTSAICKLMKNKIIPVSKTVEQRDQLMSAKKPEDVKKITPWVSAKSLKGLTTEQIIAKGVRMPPFHFHCRTTIVAA